EIEAGDGALHYDGNEIPFSQIKTPAELPWAENDVQVAVEATGVLKNRESCEGHLSAGADRVVITANSEDADLTVVMGVNHDWYDPDEHRIVSNASCTTNCLSPVAKVLDEEFGIETGFLTTTHGVTSSQSVVDKPMKKRRRGRSALTSIIPTTTGAAVATTIVLPQLEGKMDGMAMRVPVISGSVIDFVARLDKPVTVESINETFKRRADSGDLEGILGYTDDEIVSADIIGKSWSSLFDAQSTMVLQENTAKVISWYDNEWGYAARVVDLTELVAG
ncbi:MAG: type I glyceraldehyde-3-phosphate dehydrogenase, partial [Armatimonadia bacterium]|nr:type I glyceraldehyde-3-phosphate dehydrogenase [Armatimonadia bacterium]